MPRFTIETTYRLPIYRQRAYDAVHEAPEGNVVSIDYQMAKPDEKKPSAKEALEARVGEQACGVSYFK